MPIRSHFTTYFHVGYLVCTRHWQVSWLLINTPHSLPSSPVAFVICSDLQLRDSVGFTPTSLLSQTFIWHQLLHNIQLCSYYSIYFSEKYNFYKVMRIFSVDCYMRSNLIDSNIIKNILKKVF